MALLLTCSLLASLSHCLSTMKMSFWSQGKGQTLVEETAMQIRVDELDVGEAKRKQTFSPDKCLQIFLLTYANNF